MSDLAAPERPALAARPNPARAPDISGALPLARRYAATLLLVGVATVLAFVAEHVIAAPNLTLIYVLPVVIAAAAYGWGPALVATITGVLAFDFFFTAPYFSLRISSPSDIWAAALLLVIAGFVASVAAEARRRALESARSAEQATALQGVAHLVIEQRPPQEVLEAAVCALNCIFRAPAVIFLQDSVLQDGAAPRRAAAAGSPTIALADEEAARGAIVDQIHTRGGSYPFDQARFEFWPVVSPSGARCALGVDFTCSGVERPDQPERFFEPVAAYLAAALAGEPMPRLVATRPAPRGGA